MINYSQIEEMKVREGSDDEEAARTSRQGGVNSEDVVKIFTQNSSSLPHAGVVLKQKGELTLTMTPVPSSATTRTPVNAASSDGDMMSVD